MTRILSVASEVAPLVKTAQLARALCPTQNAGGLIAAQCRHPVADLVQAESEALQRHMARRLAQLLKKNPDRLMPLELRTGD